MLLFSFFSWQLLSSNGLKNFAVHILKIPTGIAGQKYHSSGVQSPTWKNTVPTKEPIPTRNNITWVLAKLSDLPKIKFPVHLHLKYILQKVFKMTGVKLTIYTVSLIGIYWYQSTNRFINSHLLIHSHKGGLSIHLMIKPPLWEYTNKLENYI